MTHYGRHPTDTASEGRQPKIINGPLCWTATIFLHYTNRGSIIELISLELTVLDHCFQVVNFSIIILNYGEQEQEIIK